MGRKRTRLELSAAERARAEGLLGSCQDRRAAERLRVAVLAATGRHTLEDLARKAGRSRSTIQNWLEKFAGGGLESLLRREGAPGATSPVATAAVQTQLQAGLKARQWTSAAHIAAWLNEAFGIKRTRKSIYYWLKKNGWPAPGAKFQYRPIDRGPWQRKRKKV